jgi:hypothetical protein
MLHTDLICFVTKMGYNLYDLQCAQDAYAIQSFERAIAAQNSGAFAWEIVPV